MRKLNAVEGVELAFYIGCAGGTHHAQHGHSLLFSHYFSVITHHFLRFFHRLVMSSSVLPFVSGTSFHTKTAATTQMMP